MQASIRLHNPGATADCYFAWGQCFQPGELPQGRVPTCALDSFQATVLNRWPDGSARFALLCGRSRLTAGQALTVALQASLPAAPTGPVGEDALAGLDLELGFAPHGRVTLASLLGQTARFDAATAAWTAGRVRTLVEGPVMSSWLYHSPLAGHPHLSAWFEVRAYAQGETEVLPWLENGWLDRPAPTSYAGELSLRWMGSTRLSQNLDLPHHCRAVALMGHLPYRRTPSQWAEVQHDTEHLQRTGLVPSYQAGVNESVLAGLVQSHSPLAQLGFPTAMGTAGYHPSIGLLPAWDACFLASGADPRSQATVLAHGMAAGRYPLHYRDPRTLRPLLPSQYPNLCLGAGSNVGGTGTSTKGQVTPTATGTAAPTWTSSHHPSLGYLAYALSGWHYFAEQVQFTACLNHLKQSDAARQGASGVLLSEAGANTTRGAAWALRTLLHATLVTPDSDTSARGEFLGMLEANVLNMHQRYVARPSNPQGFCKPYSDYTSGDGKYFHAAWMEDFLTAAWGAICSARLPFSATTSQKLSEFFAWKARSIVGRFGAPGDPEAFHYADAAQYTLAIAPADTLDYENGTGPWYRHWGEIYAATLGKNNLAASGDRLRGAYFPDATSYWGNLQPALAYAVEHGVPGAAAARARMTSDAGWPQFLASLKGAPGWGVVPRKP